MIMSTTFSERVHELMDYHRLNKNSLSVKLGFTANTTITRLANHPERNPSYELLVTILKAFPGLSGRWLLLGEGKMWVKDEIDAQTLWTQYYGKDIIGVLNQVTDAPPISRMRIRNIFLANMAEIYHLCRVIFKPLNLLMILCVKKPCRETGFSLCGPCTRMAYIRQQRSFKRISPRSF